MRKILIATMALMTAGAVMASPADAQRRFRRDVIVQPAPLIGALGVIITAKLLADAAARQQQEQSFSEPLAPRRQAPLK